MQNLQACKTRNVNSEINKGNSAKKCHLCFRNSVRYHIGLQTFRRTDTFDATKLQTVLLVLQLSQIREG